MFKARAQESDFSTVVASFLQMVAKRAGGAPMRSHPVRSVAMQVSEFLLDDPSAPLSLTPILRATTEDIDRFLASRPFDRRQSQRTSLLRFYRFLLQSGRIEKNVVADARLWPGVPRQIKRSEISEDKWDKIVDLFVNYKFSITPWNAASCVVFLFLRRNLGLTIPEIGSVTMGMARSGVIRLGRRKKAGASSIVIDIETAGVIAKYLDLLPTTFRDEELLLRSHRGLGPGNIGSFVDIIRRRAKQAGLAFRIEEIPRKKVRTWSADQPNAMV